jgi:hypothetical protein
MTSRKKDEPPDTIPRWRPGHDVPDQGRVGWLTLGFLALLIVANVKGHGSLSQPTAARPSAWCA